MTDRKREFEAPDLDMILPDAGFEPPTLVVPGVAEGWRAWGTPLDPPPFGVAPKLYSVTHTIDGKPVFWAPRKAMVAYCPRHKGDKVPDEMCGCGFYSAKDLPHLQSMSYHTYDAERMGMWHIVGQVANWGRCIEGSAGWRSQFAYPVHLYVPFEAWRIAKPLSVAYGVPVSLKNILVPAEMEDEDDDDE